MPPLPRKGWEKYARGRALGMTQRAAYMNAGYSEKTGNVEHVAKHPDVMRRVEELKDEFHWGETPDVAPVINELMRLARDAAKVGTVPAMVAARGLLAEAGKLKGRLAERPDIFDAEPVEPPMSKADWVATYVTKQ
jgi:hypothetical protein